MASLRIAACVAASGFLAAGAAGCVTGYHSASATGGYSDARLDAQTFRVSFRGNGYTPQETVQNGAFYRCAEVTLTNGFDFFVLLDSRDSNSVGYIQTPGTYSSHTTAQATAYGNTAYGTSQTYGTYTPGASIPVVRHRATALIRAFNGQKPNGVPNAFDAREVVAYLGSSVDPQGSAALLARANQPAQPSVPGGSPPSAAPTATFGNAPGEAAPFLSGVWTGSVSSTVAGTFTATLALTQRGAAIEGTYSSSSGGQGTVLGTVEYGRSSITVTSTTPGCGGTLRGTVERGANAPDTILVRYEGSTTCGGFEKGQGTLGRR